VVISATSHRVHLHITGKESVNFVGHLSLPHAEKAII